MHVRTVRNLRRISQVVFFAVFFWLVLKTTFEVSFRPADITEIRLPYPVSIALEFDPLVAIATLLSSGTVYKGLLWSLVVLIPTIFLGRFFCGWVCPLGSVNHWISEIRSERPRRRGARKIESNRYKKYQRLKYYILFAFLAAATAGTLQVGLLDPLSLLARSIGTFVLPVIHTGALRLVEWVGTIGLPPLTTGARSVYELTAWALLPFRQNYFHTVVSIGLFFIVILALNRVFTRFWCRGICPLGALLGVFSRFAIFGLEKVESGCDQCHKCLLSCQGADDPEIGSPWRQTECHLCLNCQAECPSNALRFRFFPEQVSTQANPAGTPKVDVTRRKFAASVAGGLVLFPLFRSGDAFEVNSNPRLIRPPGAAPEDDFFGRCIRCGQCMRVCPNNALHPTLFEAGLEGIWTPVLIARIGYCEPSCTLCGQVCPTGAIAELSLVEKVGDQDTPPNRIGTAFIDRGRCLPWAMATPCIVCEEWCPTSPKSVYLRDEIAYDSRGKEVRVKRPYVDPELCTGCGACEYACPVIDRPAVYMTSVGESRSARNQILLRRRKAKPRTANRSRDYE
ncbi:MAG TPA: 4Fe-4S dicluster domain-containing protein [Acidobacteriota bacterium]|nr:4Fe-4S dicluster domain-containing protein [Acidobacteriota bacterium]